MDSGFYPLFFSFVISATVGIFPLIFVPSDKNLNSKEVYLIVLFSWAAVCSFGMLPYLMWGGEFSLINAWFESVSGYTTTGGSILNDVEALPRGLLFYRSSTHLIGGVGVVFFALLVAPILRLNRLKLSKGEMSTLVQDNFMFRAKEVIKSILTVYLGGLFLCFLLLMVAGMDWFHSLNHSISTLATAGFSTKNSSIASFDDVWISSIVTFFMMFSGLHFGLIYAAITRRSYNLFRSPITRYYILSLLVASFLVSLNLWSSNIYGSLPESFQHASFQVVSMATTTGFATTDSAHWPSFTMLILLFMMLQTGCAGSTVGGIKVDRVYVFFKTIKTSIRRQQHPNAIIPIKVGDVVVDDDTSHSIILFILLFLVIIFASTVLLSLTGIDLTSAFSASIASISNVGAGFSLFGSMSNYSILHPFGKILLTVLMIAGRLEIYGLILLFFLKSWK